MRIDIDPEARERQRRVEQQHALAHPAAGNHSGCLERAGGVAQETSHVGPAVEALRQTLIAETRGRNELHIGTDALGEHLVQLGPRGQVAGLEGATRCQTRFRIGILAKDHAMDAVRSDVVEGGEDMCTPGLAGKGLAAACGKDRLPGLQIEAGVDAVEILADGSERIPPSVRKVTLPPGERFRHRLFQSCRHCAAPLPFVDWRLDKN